MKLTWNKKKNTYEIVDMGAIELAKKHIDEIAKTELAILSDDDFKAVKKSRTEVNAFVKEISETRKQMIALVISKFAPQMVEIEKYGCEVGGKLTEKMNEYKPPKEKEKTYKLTIKSKDLNAIKKIKDFALAYECEIDETY